MSERTSKRCKLENTEEDEVKELPSFIKKILKSGSYVLMLIPFSMFEEWYTSFSKVGFLVMPKPYIISYNEDQMPQVSLEDWPQECNDCVLLAKMPGLHPSGFKPDYNAMSQIVGNGRNRRASNLIAVEPSKNKLRFKNSRVLVNPKEKSITMLAELIDLFSPAKGVAVDMYGGTFTLAIACLRTARKCLVIEKEESIYDQALARLRMITSKMSEISKVKEESVEFISYFDQETSEDHKDSEGDVKKKEEDVKESKQLTEKVHYE